MCHEGLVEQLQFLNFYVSRGGAVRFLRSGENYYIYFIHRFLYI